MSNTASTKFNRDKFARHYANNHLRTDPGVKEIYYLPTNAPEWEIRLLEVNTLIPETMAGDPINFGVHRGEPDAHQLVVLDLTPDQWKLVQSGKMTLPLGLRALLQLDRTNWPLLMAGAVMVTAPVIVVFLFAQRAFLDDRFATDRLGR